MPHQCTNCGRTFDDGSKAMLSGCPDCSGTTFQFSPDGFDGDELTADTPSDPPDPPERPDDSMTRAVGNAAATVRDIVSATPDPEATQATPPDPDPTQPTPPDPTADAAEELAQSAGATNGTAASASDTSSTDDIIVAESTPLDEEDTAQADARSQIAAPDELPESAEFEPTVQNDSAGDHNVAAPEPEPATADGETAVTSGVPQAGDTDAGPETDRTVAEEPDTERAERPELAQLREELNDQFESIRIKERGQYELNLMELYDRDEVIVALKEDGRYSIRVPEAIGEADL